MTIPKLQKGDLVRVFQDPITEEHPEGVARLIRFCNGTVFDFDGFEEWWVVFGSEDQRVRRRIHIRNRIQEG